MNTKPFLKRMLDDETGATAIEYGLIVALIAIAIVVSLQGLANETSSLWNTVQTASVAAQQGARS